jgi:hypothetical protein
VSPQAGVVLMEQVAPRLKGMIPRIKPVGSEDADELFQDGLALAAKMLHDLEERGKTVTPGNVAFYVTLHLKSGRRSYGCGRTDAMFSSTQLDGKASVMSLEEEVGYDPETMEPIHLGEMLIGSMDDPSMQACRNVDWQEFIDSHDYRYGILLKDIAEGRTVMERARESRQRYSQVRCLKNRMEGELREFLGPEAIADSVHMPLWRSNIQAGKEKVACKADRRRG